MTINFSAITPDKVAICVCTCQRPRLLEQCLISLMAQQVDASLDIRIIVASNGTTLATETEEVVRSLSPASPFPITLTRDPSSGIARARNSAMMHAISQGAQWIAFIDDDEIADPGWIANLMAPAYRRFPVLMGANIYQYPTPAPFWAVDKSSETAGRDEGRPCKTASSGNVRFSSRLVTAGLRFDETLNRAGGEDNDFFSRAHEMGFQITRTYKAITREMVHMERLTYAYQIYRAYWCAASDMRRLAVHKGWWRARLSKVGSIPTNVIFGLFWLLLAAPLAVLATLSFMLIPIEGGDRGQSADACRALLTRYKKFALRGGKRLAKSVGRLAAMFGHLPQPYKTVHGA